MQSPAPTVLTTVVGGGGRVPRAVGVDQDRAAAAERGQHRADAAVDEGAGGLGGRVGVGLELGRRRSPVTEASSSAFGLSRSGARAREPVDQRGSGPSLVSTATRLTPRSRATRSA